MRALLRRRAEPSRLLLPARPVPRRRAHPAAQRVPQDPEPPDNLRRQVAGHHGFRRRGHASSSPQQQALPGAPHRVPRHQGLFEPPHLHLPPARPRQEARAHHSPGALAAGDRGRPPLGVPARPDPLRRVPHHQLGDPYGRRRHEALRVPPVLLHQHLDRHHRPLHRRPRRRRRPVEGRRAPPARQTSPSPARTPSPSWTPTSARSTDRGAARPRKGRAAGNLRRPGSPRGGRGRGWWSRPGRGANPP